MALSTTAMYGADEANLPMISYADHVGSSALMNDYHHYGGLPAPAYYQQMTNIYQHSQQQVSSLNLRLVFTCLRIRIVFSRFFFL